MVDHYKRGFSHPVIDVPDEARGDLFAEMDRVAAEMQTSPEFDNADLEVAFRQLQKKRLPELPDVEFQPLFGAWLDAHAGKMQLELDQVRQEIRAELRSRQADHPGPPLFTCSCGQSVNPADVDTMKFHQAHIIAARRRG